jgi:ribosomal peptide maturation radical SAM protein 1
MSTSSENQPFFASTDWRNSLVRERLFNQVQVTPPQEVVLVVPPPALLDRPSLSVHLLQGCAAKDAEVGVKVFYANLVFGDWIGELANIELCFLHPQYLFSERLFAASAYEGVPLLGRNAELTFAEVKQEFSQRQIQLDYAEFQKLAAEIKAWVDDVAQVIVSWGPKVVGCTTTFEQTASSVAILKAVKRLSPTTLTIIGGANCSGQMAEGIATLSTAIDYVFSGECEMAFPTFLKQVKAGHLPKDKIIYGSPCFAMDTIPTPNYQDFYEQQAALVKPLPVNAWLPYETSRGCWWGDKHACTFCGLNGDDLKYRRKSPPRVMAQLKELLTTYPPRKIMSYDNIMPHSYFKELLPQLATEYGPTDCEFYYEQKANMTLEQVRRLGEAHINVIQPGIEAVSTALLKRMKKGVNALQNLALMRYARSCGITLNWNLLYAFPGDSVADYQETLRVLPYLRHLSPPFSLDAIGLERFSPYFNQPAVYGIRNIRPLPSYVDVLPDQVDASRVAYNFAWEYECGAFEHPDIIAAIREEILAWRATWVHDGDIHTPRILRVTAQVEEGGYPLLHVYQLASDQYKLVDTRGLPGTLPEQLITAEQVHAVLVARPLKTLTLSNEWYEWAMTHKLALEIDATYVPLATAHPEVLTRFEHQAKTTKPN